MADAAIYRDAGMHTGTLFQRAGILLPELDRLHHFRRFSNGNHSLRT